MRNFGFVIRSFAGAAALATILGGCAEEAPPPKRQAPAVSAPVAAAPTPTPTPVAERPVVATATPKPVAAEPVTPDPDGDAKADVLIGAARQALQKGELDRAMKLAKLATKKAPSRAAAWNTLGRVQLKRGARKDAIASFGQAVQLNPSSSHAQNNLGLALIYDGQFEEAVDALEEATQLEPVEGYMWNNLGMAYEHLDRLDDAREAYKQAMELKGDRAKDNFARLEGVKTIRTAKADLPPPTETNGSPSGSTVDEHDELNGPAAGETTPKQ